MTKKVHITVCIATYMRPKLLNRCLEATQIQECCGFDYSIIVVDNDVEQSAREKVHEWQNQSSIEICYYVEPEQNIALARNKAVENAKGNFVAFIDDDEFPESTWLLNLYSTLISTKADGVLGPVIPHFEKQPPLWITKTGLLERPSFLTGTILKTRDTRTGNVLFDKRILKGDASPFDPRFGRTGGEDCDFFRRMIDKDYIFVWCNEARVYETVPPERFKRSYFLKRALLRGVGEAKLHSCSRMGILRSLVACSLYTVMLPLFFIIRHHLFMKYLIKDCDHIGKLLGLCGIEVLRERNF